MRSSLVSRSRHIGSLCDACRQQHQQQRRNLSIATSLLPRAATGRPAATTARDAPSYLSEVYSAPSRHIARPMSTTTRLRQQSEAASATNAHVANAHASNTSDPDTTTATTNSATTNVPQTHYDFFPESLPAGPPPAGAFSIDLRALRREFLQLQSKAHPDLHPSHLKARAEATSARINEAYRTLASPLARAQYLLSLRGRDVANDETAKVEDPELLMEVLEAREEIEEAGEEVELEPLRARNAEREADSVAELERCFAEGDVEGAVRESVRLRYWVNIRESVDNWERGKPVVLEH